MQERKFPRLLRPVSDTEIVLREASRQLFSRREALALSGKVALAGAALGPVLVAEGCNPTMWIDIVLADLPSVIQVITSFLGMLSAAGVAIPASINTSVTEYGAETSTALNLAKTLVADYNANPNKGDALQKIDAALLDAQNHLSQILETFHVTDPTLQAAASAVVGGAITMVIAIQALVPPPPAATAPRTLLAKGAGSNAIEEAFNVIVGRHYPNAVIKLA
jgi:hypothetical protein